MLAAAVICNPLVPAHAVRQDGAGWAQRSALCCEPAHCICLSSMDKPEAAHPPALFVDASPARTQHPAAPAAAADHPLWASARPCRQAVPRGCRQSCLVPPGAPGRPPC